MNKLKTTERERWFLDRVGERVFRNLPDADSSSIVDSISEGTKIRDEGHALYLHDYEKQTEGITYFESPEERDSLVTGGPETSQFLHT